MRRSSSHGTRSLLCESFLKKRSAWIHDADYTSMHFVTKLFRFCDARLPHLYAECPGAGLCRPGHRLPRRLGGTEGPDGGGRGQLRSLEIERLARSPSARPPGPKLLVT